jgi:Ca-activated chloride channel family protein
MLTKNKWILALGVVIISWASAVAQDPVDVIKIGVDLVTVNVSVTEKKGHPVMGLQQENFFVTDQGKPVPLEFFDSNGPASIVFVVDISSSMRGVKWQNLMKAMKKFLATTREGSDYTLIVFGDRPQLVARSVNASELWRVLESLRPDGMTALYDAMLLGLNALERLPQRHKALVLLSDGEDNYSRWCLSDVQQAARAHRATIYTVGLLLKDFDGAPWQEKSKDLLDKLTAATGGLMLLPAPEQISGVLERINADVSGHYCLSYYPPDTVVGWRHIQVSIARGPQQVNLRYQERYLRR